MVGDRKACAYTLDKNGPVNLVLIGRPRDPRKYRGKTSEPRCEYMRRKRAYRFSILLLVVHPPILLVAFSFQSIDKTRICPMRLQSDAQSHRLLVQLRRPILVNEQARFDVANKNSNPDTRFQDRMTRRLIDRLRATIIRDESQFDEYYRATKLKQGIPVLR